MQRSLCLPLVDLLLFFVPFLPNGSLASFLSSLQKRLLHCSSFEPSKELPEIHATLTSYLPSAPFVTLSLKLLSTSDRSYSALSSTPNNSRLYGFSYSFTSSIDYTCHWRTLLHHVLPIQTSYLQRKDPQGVP